MRPSVYVCEKKTPSSFNKVASPLLNLRNSTRKVVGYDIQRK